MRTFLKKASILVYVLILMLMAPLYAEDKIQTAQETAKPESESPVTVPAKKEKTNFLDFINKTAYAAKIDKGEERKMLRQEWKKLLNIDIFSPYFKAKEIEKKIKQKGSIKIFKLRGRPQFNEDSFKYTFEVKF